MTHPQKNLDITIGQVCRTGLLIQVGCKRLWDRTPVYPPFLFSGG